VTERKHSCVCPPGFEKACAMVFCPRRVDEPYDGVKDAIEELGNHGPKARDRK
jgi:hypothetical protein